MGYSGGTEAETTPVIVVAPASQSQSSAEITAVTVAPTSVTPASVSASKNAEYILALPSSAESQKSLISAPPLQLCSDTAAERSPKAQEGDNQDRGLVLYRH